MNNVEKEIRSERQQVNFGVPQEAVVDPLLFLIYMGNLVYIYNDVTVLFPDDISLHISKKTFSNNNNK